MDYQSEIDRIKDEEERLIFGSFDSELARRIGFALHEEAQSRSASVTIDIRAFGQQLFHLAMPGTSPDNDRWIDRKSNVVLRFHRSSLLVGRTLAHGGDTIEGRYFVSPMEYSPFGGSFPIRLEGGAVVGAVTVSGLPQEEDHALVVAVLERFCNQ